MIAEPSQIHIPLCQVKSNTKVTGAKRHQPGLPHLQHVDY